VEGWGGTDRREKKTEWKQENVNNNARKTPQVEKQQKAGKYKKWSKGGPEKGLLKSKDAGLTQKGKKKKATLLRYKSR